MTRPRDTPVRALILVVCAALFALIMVEPAFAVTVYTNGQTVYYTAEPGEANDVTVTGQPGS